MAYNVLYCRRSPSFHDISRAGYHTICTYFFHKCYRWPQWLSFQQNSTIVGAVWQLLDFRLVKIISLTFDLDFLHVSRSWPWLAGDWRSWLGSKVSWSDFDRVQFVFYCVFLPQLPSVLWHCWLGARKGIWPVKNMEWWDAGRMVVCLLRGANDLHMVQLMPLPPHHLLLQQNPEWFIILVPAYPGCPGKKAVKCLCVCVFCLNFLEDCFVSVNDILHCKFAINPVSMQFLFRKMNKQPCECNRMSFCGGVI